MFKVIQVDDSGAEVAAIELDDFVIETVYAGIASLLKDAASASSSTVPAPEISRATHQRRQKILARIHA